MLVLVLAACSDGELIPKLAPDGASAHFVGMDSGLESAGDGPEAGFPFDEPDQIFEIALDLPPDSVAGLQRLGPYVPGTFHIGEISADVGVRLKGSTTFDHFDGKPALKIAFDAFTPGQRCLGLEHLTLNNMKFDKAMMHEAVTYHVFGQLGVPAPRQGYANLTVNGQPYGLYSMIETADNEWLHRVLPDDDDGNLYDTNFNLADFTALGVTNFDLQEGSAEPPYADLQQLVQELDSGSFWDVFQRRFDVDSALTFLAVDLASPDYDGYSRNTNNYLVYHATTSDRWYLIPWGQDQAFWDAGGVYEGVVGRLAAACLGDADCKAALDQHIESLLALWDDGLDDWVAAEAAVVGPACEADTRKHEKTCAQDAMVEDIRDRPAQIRMFME